ncbi:MAG: hypothetical protein IPG82_19505 [Saprospiraceae bacterium]|nr:hypothetical protein [Saprospiraceae bacterium]
MIKYDIEAQARLDSISLDGIVDGVDYEDSFTSDSILHGNELLILDRANFRPAGMTQKKNNHLLHTYRSSAFGLAVSPDGNMAFVANP